MKASNNLCFFSKDILESMNKMAETIKIISQFICDEIFYLLKLDIYIVTNSSHLVASVKLALDLFSVKRIFLKKILEFVFVERKNQS